jgi:hypothetical protein
MPSHSSTIATAANTAGATDLLHNPTGCSICCHQLWLKDFITVGHCSKKQMVHQILWSVHQAEANVPKCNLSSFDFSVLACVVQHSLASIALMFY